MAVGGPHTSAEAERPKADSHDLCRYGSAGLCANRSGRYVVPPLAHHERLYFGRGGLLKSFQLGEL